MSNLVEVSTSDGVVHARLDNYAKRNAQSVPMLQQLVGGIRAQIELGACKVVIVSGKGGVFSSGVDVSTVRTESRDDIVDSYLGGRSFGTLVRDFEALPIVKIAMIEGYCFGAGIGLASACDVRFAADDALFRMPELDVGLAIGPAAMARIMDAFGAMTGLDMVLTGRRVSADEARGAGFLTQVHPAGALHGAVEEYARVLAERPRFLLLQTVLGARAAIAERLPAPNAVIGGELLSAFDQETLTWSRAYAGRYGGA